LKDISTLQNLKKEYTILTKELINELDEIENRQKKDTNSKLNKNRFSSYLKTLVSQNAHNNELLNTKIKEPSRSIELISLQEQFSLIEDLINEANAEIKKHNQLLNNFSTEKNSLIKSIWKLIIEELRGDYERYKGQITEINNKSQVLHQERNEQLKEYQNINNQLIKLSENITGIQPTIDEMNKILKEYDFLGFEIVAAKEEGFYQIERQNGQLAETTLSEGEITFITFLYFLQLAKGGNSTENVNQERIIIIDDPVSNLDNKSLAIISTLLKELISDFTSHENNIKQFILLTHNSIFSKELSNSQELHAIKEDTRFWILNKNKNITQLKEFVQEK
jgi:wobble nucleotide-excising tRNase